MRNHMGLSLQIQPCSPGELPTKQISHGLSGMEEVEGEIGKSAMVIHSTFPCIFKRFLGGRQPTVSHESQARNFCVCGRFLIRTWGAFSGRF